MLHSVACKSNSEIHLHTVLPRAVSFCLISGQRSTSIFPRAKIGKMTFANFRDSLNSNLYIGIREQIENLGSGVHPVFVWQREKDRACMIVALKKDTHPLDSLPDTSIVPDG